MYKRQTIILAEAESARAGVELLLDIYDDYGCYFCSGVFICDQNEVWYIENCSGTQYVALKLNDDMVFLEPNMAVIGRVDLDDTENVIASERLIEVAKEAGTFVGDEKENIIDFRASYARIGNVDKRLVQGLNFLNKDYNYDTETLTEDNTKFTISNLNEKNEIVPLYTNIKEDRQLTKEDVFNYYELDTIGKPSNQEIEIFQLFSDRPQEYGTCLLYTSAFCSRKGVTGITILSKALAYSIAAVETVFLYSVQQEKIKRFRMCAFVSKITDSNNFCLSTDSFCKLAI